MTNIKAFALVVVGILIFTGACVYASEVYSKDGTTVAGEGDLRTKATELMVDLRGSSYLAKEHAETGMFDAQKVSTVTGLEIKTALEVKGLEFQLEIMDVSGAQVIYSRSVSNGDAIQTSSPHAVVEEGQLVTVSSAANIWVGPDEIHAARLVLRVWEA